MDALLVGCTLLALCHARSGARDDPGLGWHLRIADQMAHSGGFLHREVFCAASEGRLWGTYSWLGLSWDRRRRDGPGEAKRMVTTDWGRAVCRRPGDGWRGGGSSTGPVAGRGGGPAG
ncbi:MAG: hypothetical protein GTO03_07235 [Planctomycetales bacterium]|nr:hypothetical protein [Planctomycetales bacterium]